MGALWPPLSTMTISPPTSLMGPLLKVEQRQQYPSLLSGPDRLRKSDHHSQPGLNYLSSSLARRTTPADGSTDCLSSSSPVTAAIMSANHLSRSLTHSIYRSSPSSDIGIAAVSQRDIVDEVNGADPIGGTTTTDTAALAQLQSESERGPATAEEETVDKSETSTSSSPGHDQNQFESTFKSSFGGEGGDYHLKRRQRTAHACENCRGRKAKCSGAQPSCERCLSRGLVCKYRSSGTKRRGRRQTRRPSSAPSGSSSISHEEISGAGSSSDVGSTSPGSYKTPASLLLDDRYRPTIHPSDPSLAQSSSARWPVGDTMDSHDQSFMPADFNRYHQSQSYAALNDLVRSPYVTPDYMHARMLAGRGHLLDEHASTAAAEKIYRHHHRAVDGGAYSYPRHADQGWTHRTDDTTTTGTAAYPYNHHQNADTMRSCLYPTTHHQQEDRHLSRALIEAGPDQNTTKTTGLFAAPPPSAPMPSVPSQSTLPTYASALSTGAGAHTNYIFNNSFQSRGLVHHVDAPEYSSGGQTLLYHYGTYDYNNLHAHT